MNELVSVTTADHVRLNGIYQHSLPDDRFDGGTASSLPGPPGTAILIHGLAGNFYSSRLLDFLAQQFNHAGVHSLIVNTRGHDVVNTLSQGGQSVNGGAAFEDVTECAHDLAAWTDWARERSPGPIVWIGHSLGAIKALYAQHHAPTTAVDRVVALSATRLNHAVLRNSPRGSRFEELYREASYRVEQGRGAELMQVDFPFPTWMSAAAYHKKYGPRNELDWTRFVKQTSCPTLLVFGELELRRNPAFHGMEDTLEELKSDEKISVATLADSNHFYSGQFETVWQAIAKWWLN